MKQDVIELDGAIGGGQVLRSGVSLSMVTGRTLLIRNIRAKRSRPGLMRIAGLYGRSTYKLEPLLADTCLMVSEDPALPLHGTLRLVTGKDGERELLLDTARTRQLRFTRDCSHG